LSTPVSLERLSQTLDVFTGVNDGSRLLKGRPAASARSLSRFHDVFAAIHADRPTAFTFPTSSAHPVLCLVALTGQIHRCLSVSTSSPQQQQVADGYRIGRRSFMTDRTGNIPCSFLTRCDRSRQSFGLV